MSSSMQKVKKGGNALDQISRFSRDVASRAVVEISSRYKGKKGKVNMASDLSLLTRIINTEEKQVYTIAASTNVTTGSPLVVGQGTTAQGSASNQRIGDSIKINRIDFTCAFNYGSGTTPSYCNQVFNYYIIRYLKTASTSGTTAFNINEFLNTDGNGQYTPLSFPNTTTNENFDVLTCGSVDVGMPYAPATNTLRSKFVQLSLPVNFHQEYAGSAATTITDNMVFLVVTALNGGNAGGASAIVPQMCMYFVDN